MVVKVIGKADKFELVFEKTGENRWETIVPPDTWGEYVLEIYAHDDAGNVSYITKMLYLVSKHTMQAILIPFGYAASLSMDQYTEYYTYLKSGEYTAILQSDSYQSYMAGHALMKH